MNASLVGTTRTAGQLRGVLARLALAASQIAACRERYDPDQAWGSRTPRAGSAVPATARIGGRAPEAAGCEHHPDPATTPH
jgi:hypothetical protein